MRNDTAYWTGAFTAFDETFIMMSKQEHDRHPRTHCICADANLASLPQGAAGGLRRCPDHRGEHPSSMTDTGTSRWGDLARLCTDKTDNIRIVTSLIIPRPPRAPKGTLRTRIMCNGKHTSRLDQKALSFAHLQQLPLVWIPNFVPVYGFQRSQMSLMDGDTPNNLHHCNRKTPSGRIRKTGSMTHSSTEARRDHYMVELFISFLWIDDLAACSVTCLPRTDKMLYLTGYYGSCHCVPMSNLEIHMHSAPLPRLVRLKVCGSG
ncbi:hypothetical protein BKA63DRAFT_525199, partial [Paraphoma chrysanthemicola]